METSCSVEEGNGQYFFVSLVQLHRVELERDQGRQLLEEGKARHSEELKAVQSANE